MGYETKHLAVRVTLADHEPVTSTWSHRKITDKSDPRWRKLRKQRALELLKGKPFQIDSRAHLHPGDLRRLGKGT